MIKSQKRKKKVYFLLGFVVFILAINFILSSVIKQKITSFLLQNENNYYMATVKAVDFKLLRRSITLTDVFIIPNKASIDRLKSKKLSKEFLDNVTLSSLKFKGIGLIDILFNKKISINSIEINDLLIYSFENSQVKKNKKKESLFNIDSIYLAKLKGLEVNTLVFNNMQYEVYDFALNETVFKSNPLSFKSSGIKLISVGNSHFKMTPAKDKFEIKNIYLNLEEIKYAFSINRISFNFKDKYAEINNIIFTPQIDKAKLANTFKYNNAVFDVNLEKLMIYNLQLSKLIKGEGLFIDSLNISKLDLLVYKDKRKPFDETKRPGLPHIGLRHIKFPLRIQEITVDQSKVLIETLMDDSGALMKVPISKLNAKITNLTSIKSFRKNPMKVSADAVLMKTGVAHLEAVFPLENNQNTFYFSGSLGATKLKVFDDALYPILGLKVLEGDLDKLTFSASANEKESTGKMTMLYHDLEAEMFKSKSKNEENKFLSWTVNTLIKKSNPKKNRTPREVSLHTNRIIYKGLGNYFWKTLQGGIISSIAGGNQTKASKEKKHRHKKK